MNITDAIEAAIGVPVAAVEPMGGGCVGDVYRVRTRSDLELVAKVDASGQKHLVVEGFMLQFLASESRLPVPELIHCDRHLLLMEMLPGESSFDYRSETHAAELLADLHSITAPSFGFSQDTLIGGLIQPNPWAQSWLEFFKDHRLRYMADQAVQAGRLPRSVLVRLLRFSERLPEWLSEPSQPSLIHGDVWTTNVLAQSGAISGFVDPAIYYAHPEIELAFITLFSTFGARFFERYGAIRPIEAGFFEERSVIYNLYPLLVHVRLFGGSYVSAVDQTLARFGY